MFVRYNTRKKDGKEHRYWSVVENRRLRLGHTTQRTVLYLGESLRWNHYVGFGFVAVGALFVFKPL